MALSAETFLLVVSAVIFIGFVGNLLLTRKGIPQTLFLIVAGVAVRWFSVLPSSAMSTMLPILSQVTLAMVVFDIGMSMKLREVVSEGRSAITRSVLYMVVSVLLIAWYFTAVLHWNLYDALFLGTISGGEISMVVVPYLAKRVSQYELVSNLALESVFDSLVLIILFTVLLNGYGQGATLDMAGITVISKSFLEELSIGLVGGTLLGLGWVRVTRGLGHSDYFYVATVGYVLLAYVLIGYIGGSGVITVLAIGLMMNNLSDAPASLGMSTDIPALSLNYISTLQTEISFFLRTFFLFFLGFSLPLGALSTPVVYLESAVVIGILAVARILSTESADSGKSHRERNLIESMMAQGLTPALLATTLIADSVIGAPQILPIAALVIIATNVVTAVEVGVLSKAGGGLDLGSLASISPLVHELGKMVEGLDPTQLEDWRKKVEDDARESAPPEVKPRVSVPKFEPGSERAEIVVSQSAAPYIIAAIRKHKDAMPQGTRSYFEALDELLTKRVAGTQ